MNLRAIARGLKRPSGRYQVCAEFIAPTPTLVVHGRTDGFCPPSDAQDVYDRIGGPKRIVWLDTTNHIDLYDVAGYVDPAVDAVAAWMHQSLAVP